MSRTPGKRTEDEALRALVEGTAGVTGDDFFRSLVRNLAQVLDTHGAWVTEYLEKENRLRALAFWLGDGFVDGYEYDVKGTPCEAVIAQSCLVHFQEKLVELFPDDQDLPPLNAVSYMGMPILGDDGRILGHISVLDRKKMPPDQRTESLFRIFGNRAAAELRRMQVEAQLRTREQELGRLVDSAMDGIVELDENLRISLINNAGEKLFDCLSAQVLQQPFQRFLTERSMDKLRGLIGSLDHLPEGARYLWVSGGLEARTLHEATFPAEATLSRFQVEGEPRYTLILRNVDDRVTAERRIRSLTVQAELLKEELRELHDVDDIIGESAPMLHSLGEVSQVAPTDSTVLLLGETGTGKELFARAVHAASPRRDRTLVKVNCAAIPANLMESEFFGHVKGAFTGATVAREGRFALADGGTIFLDEVGELPLDLQAKLLRVLQEGEFEPVGSSRVQKVDVRIIAATNQDLEKASRAREFREDLFYRLNVFPIRVPPLRERGADIGLLARAFAGKYAQRMGRSLEPLSGRDLELLAAYQWPGNVRELQNVMERAVITSHDGRLSLGHALPGGSGDGGDDDGRPGGQPSRPGKDEKASVTPPRILTVAELRELERQNIMAALDACAGKVAGKQGAAARLGMKPSTLSSRIKALGIAPSD